MVAVSVLMTAYNGGPYLAESVLSVTQQVFSDLELVLIDNGSTDSSVDQLQIEDSRVRVIRLPHNIGRTPALVLALQQARADMIAILDADDVAHPDRLDRQHNYLSRHPDVVLLGSQVSFIDSESGVIQRDNVFVGAVDHDVLGERNVFYNSSVMFRRDAAIAAGGYDPAFVYAQDYDLFQRLVNMGSAVVLPEVLTSIRISPISYTRSHGMRLLRAREELELFRRAPARLNLTRRGGRLNRRRQAIALVYLGLIEVRDGQPFKGLSAVLQGLTIDLTFSWIPYLIVKGARIVRVRVRRWRREWPSRSH